MQTTQDNTSASVLERRIDMTIPLAEIEKDVEQRLKQAARTIKMPGFRPGKVPLKLVAQQYGPQTRNEAIGAAVEKLFGDVVRQQNLRIAGYPRFEPKSGDGGEDQSKIEFSAIFEVYPEIVLGDVSGCEIERVMHVISEAEVDKTIEVLRKQRITYSRAERAAADGDRLVIDFTGRREGEVFPGGQGADFPVLLGSGQMLADFEAALIGMSAGETKTFDLTFPADYKAEDIAGQTVQFEVTLKAVEGPLLPELDAGFAKSLGIADGDLDKMRSEVRANLEREMNQRLRDRVKHQVMEALLTVNPIEIPKALVELESRQMAEAAQQQLRERGLLGKDTAADPKWFTEKAERRVKLGLLLAELVKVNQLNAKMEQIRAVIDDFAQTYEDPAEVVRWYYSQPERLAEAEALVLENNVVDWVLANAKAVDKEIGFDELMGNGA